MPMAAPGAPPANREEIGSPLDSLGKILYDVDITTLLLSRIGDAADDHDCNSAGDADHANADDD